MTKREFTVAGTHSYNRSSPTRWVLSHLGRYAYLPLFIIAANVVQTGMMSYSRLLIGDAFDWVTSPSPALSTLTTIALTMLGFRLTQAVIDMARSVTMGVLAQNLERDCRDELYLDLLGKSAAFHGRQRVGDIMARATNDVRQVNMIGSPGLPLIAEGIVGVIVPLVTIATLKAELLIVPCCFVIVLVITLWDYNRRLNPVSDALRAQFGKVNAGLAERISGIEVVKANSQELQELRRFAKGVQRFRDLVVKRGEIQAAYYPFLFYGLAYAAALLHALLLYRRGIGFSLGDVIAYMSLLSLLRSPTFLSLFSFSLVQQGLSGAGRILDILNAESEFDENPQGHAARLNGAVAFQNVSFGYEQEALSLKSVSFDIKPGESIAIVGQTGSGKTTLTRLIDRIYDATEGRVLLDGVDAREWSLESLRSQISAIEQDVFLFSRSVAENIAYGAGENVTQEQIENAARQAQAHEFIMALPEGYATEIGERGVTLSGGQRQRLAIARAFLADPRILILDDSTSAIDSATEDEIQKAMYRVQKGRTTFLITHRLSQIRWADRILVLRRGELVDQGKHAELVERCDAYRRIFGSYEHNSCQA